MNPEKFILGSLISMLFFFALIICLVSSVRLSTTGEGIHTGYITAIEQKGIFYKNYNVYVKTDNSSSQEDKYCLNKNNKELIQKAKLLSKSRSLVEVVFKGVNGFGISLCEDVEIINIKNI